MNREAKIIFWKKQASIARELKAVAEQNTIIATRLESEAKSALELLGAKPERTRKGNVLPEEEMIKLKASLIR